MAAKMDNSSKSLFEDDDILDSLFEDKKPVGRGRTARGGPLTRPSGNDNIFSMMAEEVKKDDGDTEDLDDMDAELFASIKKPSSAAAQTKPSGNEAKKKDLAASANNAKSDGGDESGTGGKKPNSAVPRTSSARNYRKFSFSDSGDDDGDEALGETPYKKDLDDPLDDLLDDLLPDQTKPESKARVQPPKLNQSPTASPIIESKTSKTVKTQADVVLEDGKDDLMDALGFDYDKKNPRKKETSLWPNKERNQPPQRARTRLDEILERMPSPRPLERPPPGERGDEPPSREKQQREKITGAEEEDLTFGSYQPTLGSTSEGRQSRRPSVRFSTEEASVSTTDKKPKPTNPMRHRSSADWLGLKTNDEGTFPEDEMSSESPRAPSSPLTQRKPSPSLAGGHPTSAVRTPVETPAPEVSTNKKKDKVDDDWLAGVLSRKKTTVNPEVKKTKQEDAMGLGEELDEESFVSKQATPGAPRGREGTVTSAVETSSAAHASLVREEGAEQDSPPLPIVQIPVVAPHISPPELFQGSRAAQSKPTVVPSHETLPQPPLSNGIPGTIQYVPQQHNLQNQQQLTSNSLQQLLQQQQMMQSQLLGFGGVLDAGAQLRLRGGDHQHGDTQTLQVRVIQLEGQVKTLQLERDQSQTMLESIQHQHKQDMELMESTHKTRVKLLEESAAQRETRARQDCEDLMERLAAVTRSAEQERSELQAQHQRKLAQAQQDRDREVERLRDLQRKSISEMKKDHEDQIKRLKKLKDEEIDAVTSATSQTRSLTVVIEQMEQFSSRLGDLSSRVESTHEHTAQGLEQGARHRDEQLRITQDRLTQQQKAMAEERTYLKEIISRMDTQLSEQQRQLEKERWKVTAEQAKAESTQRGLEEERRSLTMQMSMEREELERAKSALLEEQKSVMQHCAQERRKLAAEWNHFHTQEKQRHERAEREAGSLLERREGSIISLAQEQADLKLRTVEVKQKEAALALERETLERLREELEREKEKLSSTGLRLKTREQEVEAFSKLAADKFEEGERALREAKRLEAEHEARLRNIHTQSERLRLQEQRILQERMRLNQFKKADPQKEEPHVTFAPQLIPPVLQDSFLPNPELSSTLNGPPHSQIFTNSQPMMLQASLALWKYTAEKDREYLQEESFFLENLRKNRSSFNSDVTIRAGNLRKDMSF